MKRFDLSIEQEFTPSQCVDGELSREKREQLEAEGFTMQYHKDNYYVYGKRCSPRIIIYFYGKTLRIDCYNLLREYYGKQKATAAQLDKLYNGIISGKIEISFDNWGNLYLNDFKTRFRIDGSRYFESISYECYPNQLGKIQRLEDEGFDKLEQDGLTIMYKQARFELELVIKGKNCSLNASPLIYDLGSKRITKQQCNSFLRKLLYNEVKLVFDDCGNANFVIAKRVEG